MTVESVVRCLWNGWPDDRGIRNEGGIFALVAKSAEGPLRRFAAGATLPGGERLESITEQGIRFSFSQDGNTQGFERKLYAPLP
ncbi:hypothetical protein APA76_27210 [Pseudomonas aeruginosa]|nr:hypothetical protein APA76_27210 [Pseudomonas aeruginosa]